MGGVILLRWTCNRECWWEGGTCMQWWIWAMFSEAFWLSLGFTWLLFSIALSWFWVLVPASVSFSLRDCFTHSSCLNRIKPSTRFSLRHRHIWLFSRRELSSGFEGISFFCGGPNEGLALSWSPFMEGKYEASIRMAPVWFEVVGTLWVAHRTWRGYNNYINNSNIINNKNNNVSWRIEASDSTTGRRIIK